MIKVSARVSNPSAVNIAITIEMPLPEWQIFYQQVGASKPDGTTYPGWKVAAAIMKALGRVEKDVTETIGALEE